MKRIKNFEALFLAAAAMATFATYATAAMPVRAAQAPSALVQAASSVPAMQVVVIKGQRLTPAQKAAL
ncbi:hypothetical protein [Massilia sp. DWR3-1-1]|uniref:hypothetical protein n=1 Tax=Massilia sp. DWR3-1-1 TaxID=2804559 RepID=UPI003CEB3A57